jgi:putative N6-adenine-specific DNA methylase
VVGAAAESLREPDEPLDLTGADRDAGAVAAATANAERAEVADHVTFVERPLSATPGQGPIPGWVVTNPPYGARLDHSGDLRNLYARLGALLRAELAGWSVAMLVADRRLAAHSGLSLHEALRTTNGGIDVVVLTGDGRTPPPGRPPGRSGGRPEGRGGGRAGRPVG